MYEKALWKTTVGIFNHLCMLRRFNMQIEVRPALPVEMNEAKRIAEETNLLPPGFISPAYINGITPDMTLCAFVDGEMATSYASWPLSILHVRCR